MDENAYKTWRYKPHWKCWFSGHSSRKEYYDGKAILYCDRCFLCVDLGNPPKFITLNDLAFESLKDLK